MYIYTENLKRLQKWQEEGDMLRLIKIELY